MLLLTKARMQFSVHLQNTKKRKERKREKKGEFVTERYGATTRNP